MKNWLFRIAIAFQVLIALLLLFPMFIALNAYFSDGHKASASMIFFLSTFEIILVLTIYAQMFVRRKIRRKEEVRK